MDYLIFSALIGIIIPWIFITYDIGCQWSKNYQSRMANFPEHMRIKSGTKVDVLIPSWHINGGERCKKSFCLGYTKGARRTCGEEVEISWNGWNFRKIVGFSKSFSLSFHLFTELFFERNFVCKTLPGSSAYEQEANGGLQQILRNVSFRSH
jgi:hypothetical protein